MLLVLLPCLSFDRLEMSFFRIWASACCNVAFVYIILVSVALEDGSTTLFQTSSMTSSHPISSQSTADQSTPIKQSLESAKETDLLGSIASSQSLGFLLEILHNLLDYVGQSRLS